MEAVEFSWSDDPWQVECSSLRHIVFSPILGFCSVGSRAHLQSFLHRLIQLVNHVKNFIFFSFFCEVFQLILQFGSVHLVRHTSWEGNRIIQLGSGDDSMREKLLHPFGFSQVPCTLLLFPTVPKMLERFFSFLIVSEKCHALHLCGANRNILG